MVGMCWDIRAATPSIGMRGAGERGSDDECD